MVSDEEFSNCSSFCDSEYEISNDEDDRMWNTYLGNSNTIQLIFGQSQDANANHLTEGKQSTTKGKEAEINVSEHGQNVNEVEYSTKASDPVGRGSAILAQQHHSIKGQSKANQLTYSARKRKNMRSNIEPIDLFVDEMIEVHEESESWDSEEFLNHSVSSSEDNDQQPSRRLCVRFRAQTDMEDPKFHEGLIFTNRKELRDAIKSHRIKWGKQIKFEKNDNYRVMAHCYGKNCTWKLYATRVKGTDTYQIKTVQPKHKCGRTFNSRNVSAKYLAKRYLDDFRSIKGVDANEFIEKVHRELNYNISLDKSYRTRQEAKKLIEGKYKDQYTRLWDYVEELRNSDPNNTVIMTTEIDKKGKERFQRFYVSLAALREGFLAGCRPVICLDGCHLRGPHPGILLTAVGIDPNNQVYPVVYAAVEIESKATWKWFLEILIQDLHIYQQEKWTFMSDRQKGLIPAIGELLPRIEHRHCVRHLHNNFKQLFVGQPLKDRLWACARSSYINKFEDNMEELKKLDETAYDWLKGTCDPHQWCRAFFRTTPKCDILLNNLSESFNSTILSARAKPILGLLESLRMYLMLRSECKREWIKKYEGLICPKIQKQLEKLKEDSANFIARGAGNSKFQVEHMYGEQFVVDLRMSTCSCRKWDLSGIPCAHGVSAIIRDGGEPEDYVHAYYHKTSYMRAYAPVINPVNGPNLWPRTNKIAPLHPKKLRLPGRPRKARRKEPDEEKRSSTNFMPRKLSRAGNGPLKCRRCGELGHNSRRCPMLIVQEEGDIVQPCNMNKCSKCGELGHNRRTCGQGHKQKCVELPQNSMKNSETQQSQVSSLINNVEVLIDVEVAQELHDVQSAVNVVEGKKRKLRC